MNDSDKCIYGVDVDKKITPILVRDAIVNCFLDANKEVLNEMKNYANIESEKEFERMKLLNVTTLIKKAFADVEGDYDNPTKESLLGVISQLKEYASNFRTKELVNKHAGEILELIKKL